MHIEGMFVEHIKNNIIDAEQKIFFIGFEQIGLNEIILTCDGVMSCVCVYSPKFNPEKQWIFYQ